MKKVEDLPEIIDSPEELQRMIASSLNRVGAAIQLMNEEGIRKQKHFDTLIELEGNYRLYFAIVPLEDFEK